ncbi:MAG: AAA family ATPase [Anaerolineae bacterium]
MLHTINVEGFKSIWELENLELGQVNVFVGANGSGKSNFLEALGVLGAAAAGRVDDLALLRRGVRPGVPALYKFSQREKKYRRFITLSATWRTAEESATYKVGLDNIIEEPKPAWEYMTESILRGNRKVMGRSPRGASLGQRARRTEYPMRPDTGFAALVRGHEACEGAPAALLSVLEDFAIFAPTTPILRGIAPDPAPRVPVGLFGGQLAEAIETLLDPRARTFGSLELDELQELLDWVASISVGPPSRQILSPSVPATRLIVRFQDTWMREGRNVLSGYDASEGAMYVLFTLVLALHPGAPRLLAIDNFDQAMHPLLARALTKLFCEQVLASENQRQVLLTTHNPMVLDGLNLRDERIRLFTVDRHEGMTQIKPLRVTEALLQELEQKHVTLSELWVMGRLGGVPRLL